MRSRPRAFPRILLAFGVAASGALPVSAPEPDFAVPTASAAEHAARPVRVRIPAIAVDMTVDPVGLLPDGKLDTPAEPSHVGWYDRGPLPGATGNAVLDGHYTYGRKPGVFHRLSELRPGDAIYVTGDDGVERAFRVREAGTYHVSNAPLEKIFGSADGKHLNLITCAGTWDHALGHYDSRHVVFADFAEPVAQSHPCGASADGTATGARARRLRRLACAARLKGVRAAAAPEGTIRGT